MRSNRQYNTIGDEKVKADATKDSSYHLHVCPEQNSDQPMKAQWPEFIEGTKMVKHRHLAVATQRAFQLRYKRRTIPQPAEARVGHEDGSGQAPHRSALHPNRPRSINAEGLTQPL